MPIYVDVITRLDERAAAVAAREVDREFVAAGKSAGQSAGKAIESGVTEGGRAAGRSAGKAIESEVSAGGKAGGQAAAREITSEIDKATQRAHRSMMGGFATTGAAAGRGFGGAFSSQLSQNIPGVSGFRSAMSGYEGAASKTGALAGRALGMAFKTAAAGLIGVAGYTLFKGFERYQNLDAAKNRLEGVDRSMRAVGKAGIDVKAVMDVVNKTVLDTPIALDQAMGLASRAMSSAIGPLDRFMKVAGDGAVAAQSDIDTIGSALLKVANSGKVSAEELNNEFRMLAIRPVLMEQLGLSGADLEKFISDGKVGLEDLMKAIETVAGGAAKNAGQTVSGAIDQVQTAVARLGANFLGAIFGDPISEGTELVDVLGSLKENLDGVNSWVVEHKDEIREFFEGAVEVGGDLLDVLSTIADTLGGWENLITLAGGAFIAWKAAGVISTVTELAGQLGLVETRLIGVSSKAKLAGKALGWLGVLLGAKEIWDWSMENVDESLAAKSPFTEGMAQLPDGTPKPGDWAQATGGWWQGMEVDRSLTESQKQVLEYMGLDPSKMSDAELEKALEGVDGGYKPTVTFTPPPEPAAEQGYVGGDPIMDAPGLSEDGEKKKKGPRLPGAPVLEYDQSLPDGFGPAQTAAELSAQKSFLDARHKLAEKRARLAQLEQTAEATEDDILKARNEVLDAETSLQGAEMRLYEQKSKASEKATKRLNGLAKDLGDVGASLDQDFGVSKGLAGIAENITKFVANLAAAPLLGPLAAQAAYAPTQGGHGLMGILGAQGVFGPQYMNNQYAQQYAQIGPAGLGGGMGVPNVGMPSILNDTGSVSSGPQSRHAAALIQQRWGHLLRGKIGGSRDTGTAKNTHDIGMSIDIPIGPDQMGLGDEINSWLQANAGALGLKYSIWRDQGKYPGGGGFSAGGHQDHIDAHFDGSAGGATAALNNFSGAVNSAAGSSFWDIIAHFESSGNWTNNNTGGHMTSSGAPRGGLQITDGTWQAFGGQEFAPQAHLASKDQQIEVGNRIAFTGYGNTPPQGLGAWEVVTNGSTAPYGITTGSKPQFVTGGGGGPSVGGAGPLGMAGPSMAAPFGNNNVRIGGGAGLSGSGSGGGIGLSGDGAIGMAMQAGGMALDMMAPGAGQAAQMGIKLINRGIEFGGQAASIGVQGLMDTFLPFGGSELASNNWLTRIAGGIAGAAPALPNLAGGGEPPLDGTEQGQGGQGGGGVNIGDINVTNQRASEDGTGRDIEYHLSNMYAAPGM